MQKTYGAALRITVDDMMKKLFLWFYCLPIRDALLLVLAAAAVFLLLRKLAGHTPWWKAGCCVLFAACLGVILYGTLGQRGEGSNGGLPILMPFASYYAATHGGSPELYRANFMNAVLFFPAGLLGCEILPRRWRHRKKAVLVMAVLALLSMGIEYAQFRFGLGLAETDDVIHNTLGALLGGLAVLVPPLLSRLPDGLLPADMH